jgi:hypothetical protein
MTELVTRRHLLKWGLALAGVAALPFLLRGDRRAAEPAGSGPGGLLAPWDPGYHRRTVILHGPDLLT